MHADPHVDRLVALALEEDLALGDVTTDATIDAETRGEGAVKAKEPLVVAGLDVAQRVFRAVDPELVVDWLVCVGDAVAAGTILGHVRGSVRSLLRAERTALNFLQRLCGIAMVARRFAQAVAGTGARVVDTRKTTPGWRVLEKRAVRAGGGHNHRLSLGSGVLIKDNHVDAGSGVAATIAKVRAYAPHSLQVEIEVRSEAELDLALAAAADIVLLDNMDLETLARCVRKAQAAGVLTEASGGVTLETVRSIAETGVDLISSGALTHSAPSADLNMKVRRLP